jgi:hypothetical protein
MVASKVMETALVKKKKKEKFKVTQDGGHVDRDRGAGGRRHLKSWKQP